MCRVYPRVKRGAKASGGTRAREILKPSIFHRITVKIIFGRMEEKAHENYSWKVKSATACFPEMPGKRVSAMRQRLKNQQLGESDNGPEKTLESFKNAFIGDLKVLNCHAGSLKFSGLCFIFR